MNERSKNHCVPVKGRKFQEYDEKRGLKLNQEFQIYHKMTCVPSEYSDLPKHPLSLIRVCAAPLTGSIGS